MQLETIAATEAERMANSARMADLTATSGPPSAAEAGCQVVTRAGAPL